MEISPSTYHYKPKVDRKIVGWALSKNIDADLCLDALTMAIQRRKPSKGIIHHSDRGVQYLCHKYVDLLKESGFEISNSARGNPYENAFIESFNKTLKVNEIYLAHYDSMAQVLEDVPKFIEEVYNEKKCIQELTTKPLTSLKGP